MSRHTGGLEENQEPEVFRDWAALPGQVLKHVFQDDPTTALRRPARAVCRSWRAAINAHVRQAYCDVSDVPLLQSFTGLTSVIIDDMDLRGRIMRQYQQRFWANHEQQQSQVPQHFIPSDPLAPPAHPHKSIRSSSSRQQGRRGRMPLDQPLADLGRLEISNPPVLDLSPLEQLPGLQDVTLRCLHLVRRLPLHTEHLGHVTSLTLHQMHTTTQTRRVDNLPKALLQLQGLRRLALVGIRQKSAAQVLEPAGPFVHPSLCHFAQNLVDTAGSGGSGSSMPAQQQQQQQQEEVFVLAHVLEQQVGLRDITGEAHASFPTAAAAAASAAAAAAAIDAAADAMGPSSMGTRRPRTLPCPWLGTLQCLVLRSCALNALPAAALASLTALTSLDLSNNFLPLLPSGLRFLKQLQVLILDNNYMRRAHQLPWSGLTALTHLSLSSCPSLMGPLLALSELVGLQRLGAAGNGLAPVGASLAGCTALKVLDVRGTRIGRSLSAALIHQLPALQRCLYCHYRPSSAKWEAAVCQAAVLTRRLHMVEDQGWVGTYDTLENQDYWVAKDWVDQEASSGSCSDVEGEEASSLPVHLRGRGEPRREGNDSEEGEEGGSGEGSDNTQMDPSTGSVSTYNSTDSAAGSMQELEAAAEGDNSWDSEEGADAV